MERIVLGDGNSDDDGEDDEDDGPPGLMPKTNHLREKNKRQNLKINCFRQSLRAEDAWQKYL